MMNLLFKTLQQSKFEFYLQRYLCALVNEKMHKTLELYGVTEGKLQNMHFLLNLCCNIDQV